MLAAFCASINSGVFLYGDPIFTMRRTSVFRRCNVCKGVRSPVCESVFYCVYFVCLHTRVWVWVCIFVYIISIMIIKIQESISLGVDRRRPRGEGPVLVPGRDRCSGAAMLLFVGPVINLADLPEGITHSFLPLPSPVSPFPLPLLHFTPLLLFPLLP